MNFNKFFMYKNLIFRRNMLHRLYNLCYLLGGAPQVVLRGPFTIIESICNFFMIVVAVMIT